MEYSGRGGPLLGNGKHRMRILVATLLTVLLVGCSNRPDEAGGRSGGEPSTSGRSTFAPESADNSDSAGRDPEADVQRAEQMAQAGGGIDSKGTELSDGIGPGAAADVSDGNPVDGAGDGGASQDSGVDRANDTANQTVAPVVNDLTQRRESARGTVDLSPQGLTQQPSDSSMPVAEAAPAVPDQDDRATIDSGAGGWETDHAEVQTIEIPGSWWRLSKEQEIWIDNKAKQVIVAGQICLREGALELFICPRRTKEHESVISVNALASQVHACFLALGVDPGSPVQWQPEYAPATGPVIKIEVMWKEKESGEIVRRRAQEMVRNSETKELLQLDWVFGGSQIYEDPREGVQIYYGDSGELVCLSNFSTATMDLPIRSSDVNDSLLFEANTPMIPEIGTKVYVIFTPVRDKADENNGQTPTESEASDSNDVDSGGEGFSDGNVRG